MSSRPVSGRTTHHLLTASVCVCVCVWMFSISQLVCPSAVCCHFLSIWLPLLQLPITFTMFSLAPFILLYLKSCHPYFKILQAFARTNVEKKEKVTQILRLVWWKKKCCTGSQDTWVVFTQAYFFYFLRTFFCARCLYLRCNWLCLHLMTEVGCQSLIQMPPYTDFDKIFSQKYSTLILI